MKPSLRSARSILRVLLTVASIAGGSSPARAGLQTGLLAYYHLDGNGVDSSGNGLNLDLVGNPSFGAGVFGQALSLVGNNSQYATRPGDDSALNFGSSDFAIQVWVNFNSFGGQEQTLVEKFSGAGGPGWTLTTPGGDSIQFYAQGLPTLNAPNVSITPGTWNQIIVDRSGSSLGIYLDGSLIASDTNYVGSITPTTNPLLIGKRDDQSGQSFPVNGRLDEIALWDRALSTGEIASLWNSGNGMLIATSVPEPSGLTLAVIAIGAMGLTTASRRSDQKSLAPLSGDRERWD